MDCAKNFINVEKDAIRETSELLNIYDSLVEINLTTGLSNAIFYNEVAEETKSIYKTSDLKTTLAKTIHSRDRKKFGRLFSEGSFRGIIKSKRSKRVEFRIRCNEGVNKKIKMCLTPYCDADNDIVLCYNYIVKTDVKNDRLSQINTDFNNLLKKTYRSIYIVDLKTRHAVVFKNAENPKTEGDVFEWDSFIKGYSDNLVCYNDKKMLYDNFNVSGLITLYKSERDEFRTDIRRKTNESKYFWVEIGIKFGLTGNSVKAYFTERDSDEIHLLQAIVDKFVYNSCDFFIYLDVRNNSYTMFSCRDRKTPRPSVKGYDYASDIMSHINEYVIPEEKETVIDNFSLEKVVMNLEASDEYLFSYGIVNKNGVYNRKLVKYVYYDRLNKMVLLIRSDITEQYLEQLVKNNSLKSALECAQRDPLTQLYNKRAVKDHINKKLLDICGKLSALLFLDLDDFKSINDNLGHSEGDATLKIVAESLTKSVRHTDLVGRFGGDEFVIFIPEITSKGEVLRCVERIFKCFDNIYNEYVQSEHTKNFSCSIGIAFYPENGENFDMLVEKADLALYKSKSMGKNCCSIYCGNIKHL